MNLNNMELLIIIIYFFQRISNSSLDCESKMVTSYGFDGMDKAKNERMLFCPEVEFKCCSLLDELKYHKFWKNYYLKKHEKSFDLFDELFKKTAAKIGEFFAIDLEDIKKVLVIPEDVKEEEIMKLYEEAKKFEVATVDKILPELENVQEKDLDYKKKFLCYICDLKNHLAVSEIDKKAYFNEQICETVINDFKNYLKNKIFNFDAILVKLHKFFNHINIQDKAFIVEEEVVELGDKTVQHADVCLKGSFKIDSCRNLCAYYSIANLSKAFLGDLDLMRGFIKRVDFLKNFIEGLQEMQTTEGGDSKKEVSEEAESKDEEKDKDLKKNKKKKKKLKNRRLLSETTRFFQKVKTMEQKLKKYKNMVSELKKRRLTVVKTNPVGYYRYLNLDANTPVVVETVPQPVLQQMPQMIQPMPELNQPQMMQPMPQLNQPQMIQPMPELNQPQMMQPMPELNQPQMMQPMPQLNQPQMMQEVHQETPEEKAKREEMEKQEMKEKYQHELKMKLTNSMYLDFYDKFQKGTEEDFNNLNWITNQFFEGDFLADYMMGFHINGPDFNYTISESFNLDMDTIMEEMQEILNETPESFEIPSSPLTTFNVIEFLNQYVVEDICDFNNDVEMVLGGISEGDDIDYNQILADIAEDRKNKEKEQKLKEKEEEEKNKKKKKEGEEGDGSSDEDNDEKTEEGDKEDKKSLKSVKLLKKKLKSKKQKKIKI